MPLKVLLLLYIIALTYVFIVVAVKAYRYINRWEEIKEHLKLRFGGKK